MRVNGPAAKHVTLLKNTINERAHVRSKSADAMESAVSYIFSALAPAAILR